jgi:hypothetical protein
VREDSLPHRFEGDVLHVLRLWTRCGFEVPDPQEIEIWPGPYTPVGQTCMYCTRSFLVGTLPPLGTPPGSRTETSRAPNEPLARSKVDAGHAAAPVRKNSTEHQLLAQLYALRAEALTH